MRCRMHESNTRNESASLSKNISSSASELHSLENLRLKNSELAVSVEIVVWKTSPPTLRKTLSLVRARFFEVMMSRGRYHTNRARSFSGSFSARRKKNSLTARKVR